MAMAVIVPPIPAIVLGVVLLLLRLGRERQYIAPNAALNKSHAKSDCTRQKRFNCLSSGLPATNRAKQMTAQR